MQGHGGCQQAALDTRHALRGEEWQAHPGNLQAGCRPVSGPAAADPEPCAYSGLRHCPSESAGTPASLLSGQLLICPCHLVAQHAGAPQRRHSPEARHPLGTLGYPLWVPGCWSVSPGAVPSCLSLCSAYQLVLLNVAHDATDFQGDGLIALILTTTLK